ncbi:MAG: threonylcarbamoyl-AMP synthase [Sphingobacteriales bacterium]|nr:MAG: threonylcarbamoyl-AMP synthase [Sphingobacteriales bacterium]TAF83883.1 MAG: threonylcarbamoyl-AMP synthase [Sphingobacteriales bacterium]
MLKNEVLKALEVLKNGGIIVYPTDTVWCIGCDATHNQAVKKIKEIKKCRLSKGFNILLDSDNKLQSFVKQVPEVAYDLIQYAEKPLTIIYSGAKNLAQDIITPDGSIGICVVKHRFCQQLIQQFRKPLVATSANISGDKTPKNFSEINPKLFELVDYVVNIEQNVIKENLPSTIMKLEADGTFKFL